MWVVQTKDNNSGGINRHNYCCAAQGSDMRNDCLAANPRRLKDDENADVLGMPLHLAILIIVAGLALVTIIGWFAFAPTPKVLDVSVLDPATEEVLDFVDEGSHQILIKVVDGDEDGVSGVLLTVSGCSAEWGDGASAQTTNSDGEVTVDLVTSTGSSTCEVTLKVEKSDWPSTTTTIMVVGSN